MDTDAVRSRFADFVTENRFETMLRMDSCATIDQDVTLKYERIDRYRVLLLTNSDIKLLMAFCKKHDITVWFGADKLCLGYNYRGNMRLSAYSVPLRANMAPEIPDRSSVRAEIQDLSSPGDRIEPDHHLDVYGGVD